MWERIHIINTTSTIVSDAVVFIQEIMRDWNKPPMCLTLVSSEQTGLVKIPIKAVDYPNCMAHV